MLIRVNRTLGNAGATVVVDPAEPPTGGAQTSPPMSIQDGLNRWRSPGDAVNEVQTLFRQNTAAPPLYVLGLIGVPAIAIMLLTRGKR